MVLRADPVLSSLTDPAGSPWKPAAKTPILGFPGSHETNGSIEQLQSVRNSAKCFMCTTLEAL